MARANAFWPTAVVSEADSVNSVSASACHIGAPKGVSPGQKALLHGTLFGLKKFEIFHAYRYPRFEVFQRQQNVFQKFSPCIQRSIQFKIEIFVAT